MPELELGYQDRPVRGVYAVLVLDANVNPGRKKPMDDSQNGGVRLHVG